MVREAFSYTFSLIRWHILFDANENKAVRHRSTVWSHTVVNIMLFTTTILIHSNSPFILMALCKPLETASNSFSIGMFTCIHTVNNQFDGSNRLKSRHVNTAMNLFIFFKRFL